MINKVILVGHVGSVETKDVNGKPLTKISVATTERWTTKEGKQEKTEWHRVTLWGQSAIFAGTHVQKGHQVFVEGKISSRKYQTPKGDNAYSTEIIATRIEDYSLEKRTAQREESGELPQSIFDDDDEMPF